MKAIIYTHYGSPDVLKVAETEKPKPKENEVLVSVRAVSINAADWHLLRADPFIIRLMVGNLISPKYQILGADIAGKVETVGKGVTLFRPGDEVFGDISACGWGGLAEYAAVSENALVTKPVNISFEEAAAVPLAAVAALKGLRDMGKIEAGKSVLINGASGGVGTFAVQIAKYFGAEVTAVCSSRNLDLVKSIGADNVVDYTHEDFTKNGKCYDLILAANGYHSIWDYKRSLNPNGIYVATGGTMPQIFQGMLLGNLASLFGNKKLGSLASFPDQKDLTFIKGLLEAGKVKPVIDRRFPFTETADGFRYLEEGHARGKIVITI